MVKAALFDLDGTLIDTYAEYRLEAVNRALSYFRKGVDQVLADAFWYGSRDRGTIVEEEFKVNIHDFKAKFDELDTPEKRMSASFVYDGVRELLTRLKAAGKITGVVTGSLRNNAEAAVRMIDENLVDHLVCTGCNGIAYKPQPDGLQVWLAQKNLTVVDAAYLGNAEEDWLAAQRAGMKVKIIYREHHQQNVPEELRIKNLLEALPLFGIK